MDTQPKESRLEEFIENPIKALWKLSLPNDVWHGSTGNLYAGRYGLHW